MITMTPTTLITRSRDLLATELDGELALLSIEQGNYYGLKGTARRIWDLTETPCSVGDLCTRLATEYNAPSGRLEADVMAFLSELAAETLVRVS